MADLEITKEHFEIIGRIAYQWSALESFVDQHLIMLKPLANELKHDNMRVSFKERIKLWRKLTRALYDENLISRITPLIDLIHSLRDERDTVVHGQINTLLSTPEILVWNRLQVSSKKYEELDLTLHPMTASRDEITIAQFRDLPRRIFEAHQNLWKFLHEDYTPYMRDTLWTSR